ncbi:(2Fe-2S)-binding protein [Tepidimicrobium xylanilyticum]|uniref:Purine hydroxylase delta subunit apoprotein n=1 Tax=Tepidimicrobium xylanilyticum TaxID=1123352 RepID=A0A1H2RI71_9FIRM|nr:(2Fe-2S)-binding protein [Tepidimicrobium xylanilyticum]GMG95410.1 (2Fe-2S)-binding protein [Tepidimicrobium xylanilyticum]SDW19162.1 purine hydroxylase delta subunit apoprotein [Tepidimicrobium xylanilyticum]
MVKIDLVVNGVEHSLEVREDMRLIDLLREELGLTGVKEGCSEGECGACTVIMDGKTVNSCLVMAFQAHGSNIITIEGLEEEGKLHPLQKAFIEVGAVQCGFCTPGMILSAKALLDKNPDPTEEEIREGISGNLCRCTGYNKIVEAINRAKGV